MFLRQMIQGAIDPAISVRSMAAATALLQPRLAGLAHERLAILYLDRGLRLLKLAIASQARADRVEVPLREVICEALMLDAHALILAHNHPAGSPMPSPADRSATRRLAQSGHALGIRVIDHLLFAGETVVSFRALGLI